MHADSTASMACANLLNIGAEAKPMRKIAKSAVRMRAASAESKSCAKLSNRTEALLDHVAKLALRLYAPEIALPPGPNLPSRTVLARLRAVQGLPVRKRGGQPGNRNRLKHGRFTRTAAQKCAERRKLRRTICFLRCANRVLYLMARAELQAERAAKRLARLSRRAESKPQRQPRAPRERQTTVETDL